MEQHSLMWEQMKKQRKPLMTRKFFDNLREKENSKENSKKKNDKINLGTKNSSLGILNLGTKNSSLGISTLLVSFNISIIFIVKNCNL